MIRKILVPLDGSPLAEQGLLPACRLARETGATLVLVRAVQLKYDNDAHEALGYLQAVRQRLEPEGYAVQTEVLSGQPVEEIVSAAAHHADLISMATHGYSGLRRTVLGSVAEAVLQQATTPVLLARAAHTPVEPVAGPFRKILIPLDGTTLSEMALTYLKQEQLCADAEVLLLRVVEPEPKTQRLPVFAYTDTPRYAEPDAALLLQREQAEGYLSAMGYALNTRSRQALVTVGDPAREILDLARNEAADLLVMVTHGRHGIDQLAHGSVAKEVLHHAEMPMLLLPGSYVAALAPEAISAETRVAPVQDPGRPITLGRRAYEGSAG